MPYLLYKKQALADLQAKVKMLKEEISLAEKLVEIIRKGEQPMFPEAETSALIKSLKMLQEELQQINKEEERRNWATEGMAHFSEILRTNYGGLSQLCDQIISQTVKYLSANQGALFLRKASDERGKQEEVLEMAACYAYDRKKFINRTISPGEGIVGQCFFEAETVHLKEVPEGYINITSGLGDAPPRNILLIPLKANDDVQGVIELASFTPFAPYQIAFLEKLGETIASTVGNARINEKTRVLLELSQSQTEELRAQEEEMRQNMEELEATQEEMRRINTESENTLSAINKALLMVEFNPNGEIIKANQHFLDLMGYQKGEAAGRHHRIFLFDEDTKTQDYSIFWQRCIQGEAMVGEFRRMAKNGEEIWIRGTYSPILNHMGEVVKILKLAYDITLEKHQQQQLNAQQEIIAANEKMLHERTKNIQEKAYQRIKTLKAEFKEQLAQKEAQIIALQQQAGEVNN